jgi:hypothetical protein
MIGCERSPPSRHDAASHCAASTAAGGALQRWDQQSRGATIATVIAPIVSAGTNTSTNALGVAYSPRAENTAARTAISSTPADCGDREVTPPDGGLAIDPVCRMPVDPNRAAGWLVYENTTYFFCTLLAPARSREAQSDSSADLADRSLVAAARQADRFGDSQSAPVRFRNPSRGIRPASAEHPRARPKLCRRPGR